MKKRYLIISGLLASFAIGFYLNAIFAQKPVNDNTEKTEGPASLMLNDPDGNVILLDQHR